MLFIRSAGCADATKRELLCDARVSSVNRLDYTTFHIKPLKLAGSKLTSNVASSDYLLSVIRDSTTTVPLLRFEADKNLFVQILHYSFMPYLVNDYIEKSKLIKTRAQTTLKLTILF